MVNKDQVYQFQPRDEIEDEAYQWVLLFNGDRPVTTKEVAALQGWVERSPLHKQILKEVEAFWCEAEQLSQLAVPLSGGKSSGISALFSRLCNHLLVVTRAAAGVLNPKRAVMASLSLVVCAALLYVVLPPLGSVGNGIYTTGIGEQEVLILRDTTQLQLDTNSQVKIDYQQGVRKIVLIQGKVHFEVAKNSGRPFEVYAGAGLVRAVGTAFSVYLAEKNDAVEVLVNEGRVELERTGSSLLGGPSNASSALSNDSKSKQKSVFAALGQGEGVRFNREQHHLAQLTDKEMEQALSWRDGILVFVRDPLGDVVSEVSRYTDITIEVADPDLKNLIMGGRFRAGEIDALLEVLEIGFGVKVIYLSERHVQLGLVNRER